MLVNPSLTDTFKLNELLKDLTVQKINNFRNVEIDHITNNSQQVVENSLFVAIKGYKTDGHKYILEAVNNGASAVVGEREKNIPSYIPYIKVKDSRKALAKLAARFYDYPGEKLKLIGVTGSAGKTTTSSMVDNIITQVTAKNGLIGTLHTKIKDKLYRNPNDCTTPNALELRKRLAAMYQQNVDYVSMEVSSHALKLNRVFNLDFDIGIFTNLSYDHMNFHQTLEDYYKSKEKLFKNLTRSAAAIINNDDKYSSSLINAVSTSYYTYGLKNQADVTASKIKLSKKGTSFKLNINNPLYSLNGKLIEPISLKINLSVLGKHNIYNALAASLAGLMLDFDLPKIKQGLESFSGAPRRLELVYDQDFTIIDDFAHNPASITANFNTIKKFNYNKLIIIHFLKGKRGIEANRYNAQLIKEWQQNLNLTEIITTRGAEEVIAKNKVLPEEEAAFTEIIKTSPIKITNFDCLTPAVETGLEKVSDNDLLLLLGGPGLNRAQKIIKELT